MALLTHLIASTVHLKVGTLTMQYGNIHVYQNHEEIFKDIQAQRIPRQLPKLKLNDNLFFDVDTVTPEEIELQYYSPDKSIKYEISK